VTSHAQHVDDLVQRPADAGADVPSASRRAVFQQVQIRRADERHRVVFPQHLQIPQFDRGRPSGEVIDDLGDDKLPVLSRADVVEGAGDHDGQSWHIPARQQLHRGLTRGVMVRRGEFSVLIDRRMWVVAVDVGAAGKQHTPRRKRQRVSSDIQN